LNLCDPEKEFDINEASDTLQRVKRKFSLYAAITVFFGILMFTNILITVIFTGADADISDFNNTQSTIFISFIIIEILTIALCFIFANRTGKQNYAREKILHRMAVYKAKLNKNTVSDHYGTLLELLFYNEYLNRVRCFCFTIEEKEFFAYMIEGFDYKNDVWKLYQDPTIFNTYDDLKKHIEERFYDEHFEE